MRSLFTDHPSSAARIVYLVLIIASAVSIGLLAWQANRQSDELARQVTQVNRALCLRKTELRSQIKGARQFLRQHPNGTADLPAALIRKSIQDNEVTLATLSDLRCL